MLMEVKVKNILLIILLVATVSCQQAPNYSQTVPSFGTPIIISATPTILALPTSKPTVPKEITPSFNPTFVLQNRELQNHLSESCILIKTGIPHDETLNAAFVLYDRLERISYVQTLANEKKLVLENANRNFVEVSPDWQWVAYLTAIKPGQRQSQLIVQSFDGKVQKKIDSNIIGNVKAIAGWLNDQYIVLELKGNENTARLTAVNPFTSEQKNLPTDFPNIYNNDPWSWGAWGRTLYSPDYRYVIYPSTDRENGQAIDVLWDMNSHKKITAITVGITGNLLEAPQWDPGAKMFAVEVAGGNVDDLYSANVDGDGTITELTNILNLFPNVTTQINGWSWSPDSRSIAFWLDIYQDNSLDNLSQERLLVLNVETGNIVDYCVQADSIQVPITSRLRGPMPIWSPNGKFLLVENWQSKNQSQLIIIDISKNIGYEVAKDVYPFGWMVSDK